VRFGLSEEIRHALFFYLELQVLKKDGVVDIAIMELVGYLFIIQFVL